MQLLYKKRGHTVYLTENGFEFDPMVSMSSWEVDTDPVTIKEWVKTTSDARKLCRRLVRVLESNGYKLSKTSNE